MIGTDWIGSCKSNCYTITTTSRGGWSRQLVMIGTDWIGSCKSDCYMITTTPRGGWSRQ